MALLVQERCLLATPCVDSCIRTTAKLLGRFISTLCYLGKYLASPPLSTMLIGCYTISYLKTEDISVVLKRFIMTLFEPL